MDALKNVVDWEQRQYELAKEIFVNSQIPDDEITFSSPGPKQRAEDAIREAEVFLAVYRGKIVVNG